MKDLIFFAGSMFCIAAMMCSCSNEVENPIEQQDKTTRSESTELLTITYNGITYRDVPTTYDENGNFIFLDNEFALVYEKEFANKADMSINIKSSDEIEIFHDLKTNLESNGYNYAECEDAMVNAPEQLRNTRIGYENLASVELFDDKGFGDLKLTYHLTSETISVAERRLHYQNFNDKCSSLKITNNIPNDSTKTIQLGDYEYICSKVDAVFIGYENKDYSKSSITFIAPAGGFRYATSLPGFNDKMSSFRFFFAQNGQYSE